MVTLRLLASPDPDRPCDPKFVGEHLGTFETTIPEQALRPSLQPALDPCDTAVLGFRCRL